MTVLEKSIEVAVPVSTVYDQWTQFEDYPQFMGGVKEVEQLDDATLRWTVSIAGVERSFEAQIVEQEPDRRIAWRAIEGQDLAGAVTFAPVDELKTRVMLRMSYEPHNWVDKIGDLLDVVDRQVESDLEAFRTFVEDRGMETGAWRGRIGGGEVMPDDPAGHDDGSPQPPMTGSGLDGGPETSGMPPHGSDTSTPGNRFDGGRNP